MKVLVHFEHEGGAIKRGSLSALDFARDVASQTDGAVTGLIVGGDTGDAAADAARYAPVLVADDGALQSPVAGAHAQVIADAATSGGFDLVVGAATSAGKDVLGRVGGLLGGFMASDVVGHEVRDGALLFRRPMFAGSAIATVRLRGGPQVVTVRDSSYEPSDAAAEPGAISALSVDTASLPGDVEVTGRRSRKTASGTAPKTA